MKMTIKVPLKDLEKRNIHERIEEHLKADPNHAYTVGGLMVDVFGVKKEKIASKSFNTWDKGLPTMYSQITACLKRSRDNGTVRRTKHGKAWVYWWVNKKV